MNNYVVTLTRAPKEGTSLQDSVERNRAVIDQFRKALDLLVCEEGLVDDLGAVEPTSNLPIVFVEGTDRLASRIRGMSGVRNVARDMALQFQVGQRSLG